MSETAIGETFNAEEDEAIYGKKNRSIERLTKVLFKELIERKTEDCDWDCSDNETKKER